MAITPQRVLHDYLLLALTALGGSATKRQALDWIDEHFGVTLTVEDRQSQPRRAEPKWENQTAWERNRMVETGLIAPFIEGVTERGRWTLTRAGRTAAIPIADAVLSGPSREPLHFATGQTPVSDPQRRRKIEDAAQDRLMALYRADGWEVVDTRVGHPYDARAFKGDVVRYLEAKGTTSAGESVIVTRNEVEWARTHVGECVMGIWSGIEFSANDEVLSESGEFRLFDWDPAPAELVPTQYDWVPDAAKLL
ncbi:hypothetical protein GCM10009623_26410 [Nocardioides aestuarii]|uniref:Winged helix-turn-helix domain-containing protein n=1 Tax=Nocardioides aestuarii TaxID=252231 RepID=A0ABW4TQ75_9ACTN